ncbi:drs2 neo1 protein, partial [Coemansia biformis]
MMAKGADSAIWSRLCSADRLRSDPGDMSFRPRPSPPVTRVGPAATRHKVSRLGDGRMYFGELGGGRGRSGTDGSAPPSAAASTSGSPRAPGFFAAGEDASGNGDTDGSLPLMMPHARLLSHAPHHRRLMSESQFSTQSEASSFTDTLGRVEVPVAFATPTAEEEEWARARALEALHQFSTEGLRTLAYAHKEIDPDVYESWHARYLLATTAIANRQQQVEAVCEEIERDMLLSGISAIEDRLQEGVPETIFKLRRAGIRVWMLTGDKVETAINIAKSCRLVETDVVETTELDAVVLEKNPGRMVMLVMQSLTDVDELDRLVSNALEVAQHMSTTVDQRFEARSIRAKLRRGLKSFGNLLNVRRMARQRGDATAAATAESSPRSDSSMDKGYSGP